jgi:hypothetical protein
VWDGVLELSEEQFYGGSDDVLLVQFFGVVNVWAEISAAKRRH